MGTTCRPKSKQYTFAEKRLVLGAFFAELERGRDVSLRQYSQVCGVNYWTLRSWMEKVGWDSEFVSWQRFTAFEELLVGLDVEYIASGPDKKENQGKIERWHQTVRQALRERGPLDHASEAQLWIRGLVDLYNYERPHQAIGGLVPADRFFGVHEELEAELERHRAGERAGQRIYLACRVGGRRLVLSGPSGDDLSLHLDGARLAGEVGRRCAQSGVKPLPDRGSGSILTRVGLSGRSDRQLEEKTVAPEAGPKEQADAGHDHR